MTAETMKRTAWEIIVAVILATVLIVPWMTMNLINDISRLQVQMTEPEDYLIVRGITVRDSVEGTDPVLIYDRTIVRPFRGKWIAGIFLLLDETGANYGVCNNSGEADYQPETTLPATVKLAWYIERDCKLEPGKYVLKTTWEIKLPHDVTKYVRATSNVFEVRAKN